MKRIAKLLTTFVMLVSMFMPSAFALGDYAVWTGDWPFMEDGTYIGFGASTSTYGVVGDYTRTEYMHYALNLDNNQLIYFDDYGYFADRDLNEIYPTNWEALDVNENMPSLSPVISIADFDAGECDYIWADEDGNLWVTVVVGNNVLHIDKNRYVYGARFDSLTLDEATEIANAMDMNTVTTPYYDPAGLRNLLETSDIPDPDQPSIELYLIAAGIGIAVAVVACLIRSKLNKKRRAILEAQASTVEGEGFTMKEEPKENASEAKRDFTTDAAEAAAKASKMASDAAAKATDAAKTAAFMAKEKKDKFSAAFKEAQERQKAAEAEKEANQNESGHVAYCSRCGTKVDADAKFCPNCGTQLK